MTPLTIKGFHNLGICIVGEVLFVISGQIKIENPTEVGFSCLE